MKLNSVCFQPGASVKSMGLWNSASQLSFDDDLDDAWSTGRLLLLGDDGEVVPPGEAQFASSFGAADEADLFLGTLDGVAWFARHVAGLVGAGQTRAMELSPGHRQLVTRALALHSWHLTSPRCDNCGGPSQPGRGGRIRLCTLCGSELFPRTDPAVIVAVLDPQDRLLLAHHTAWAPGRVSVLAGFVEAGESAEQACYREIVEESGVQITDLQFFGTQPWPYPRSLMLGFTATTTSTQVTPDGAELEWGGFFRRDEVRDQVAAGELILPGKVSIASRMVDQWLAGNLRTVG